MHINLDDELVEEVDRLAGPRGRSRLIREAIEAEVDRRRRRLAFERSIGAIPDFAPEMTAESISAERKRESAEEDRKLARHWGAESF